MDQIPLINAKLVISGALECRDKDGNLLKTIPLNSEVPLASLLIEQKDQNHDDQRCE